MLLVDTSPTARDILLRGSTFQGVNDNEVEAGNVQGIDGVAEFERLGIDRVGKAYALHFTAPGLMSASPAYFSVEPGPPIFFEIEQQPSDSRGGVPFPRQPRLLLRDRGLNFADMTQRPAASVELWSNPTGTATLRGTSVIESADYLVSFTDISISLLSRKYLLKFSVWALHSNGTRDFAAPNIRARFPGGSVSGSFLVSDGDAAALSIRPVIPLGRGAVYASGDKVTLVASHRFVEAVEGMDLVLLDARNASLLVKPTQLLPAIYSTHPETGDVVINITHLRLIEAFLNQSLSEIDMRYEISLHAGFGSLVLSASDTQEAAHGRYEIRGFDEQGSPVYVQHTRASVYVGGANTCMHPECDASSDVLSAVSGVYVPLEISHHSHAAYRKGIFVLYHAGSSVEPAWRISRMLQGSSDPTVPFMDCQESECNEPHPLHQHCIVTAGGANATAKALYFACLLRFGTDSLLYVNSASIRKWDGSHHLFLDAKLQQWVVHQIPPGVEKGFAGDPSGEAPCKQVCNDSCSVSCVTSYGKSSLDFSNCLSLCTRKSWWSDAPKPPDSINSTTHAFSVDDSACRMCASNAVVRKYDERFWFSVERGNYSDVRARCQFFGGDLASIHSDLEAQIASDVCQDADCYIGLNSISTQNPPAFWWTDETAVEYHFSEPAGWREWINEVNPSIMEYMKSRNCSESKDVGRCCSGFNLETQSCDIINDASILQQALAERWILNGSDGRQWHLVGNGSQMFRGVCKVPQVADCAQCRTLVLRANASSTRLPDHVIAWQERKVRY